jgi:hypothetical protein
VGAEEREELGDRLETLQVREGVVPARPHRQLESPRGGELGEELGAVRVGRAKLEVGVARPAD